ncbi:MAG: ABC transporter permease subunit [Oscillospiraceae bacterium]|nr:ABC transporter permease subunit [Ruminococcus sp.]MCD8345459.1 ABC transporter permease subunit [Oscillospiraceae bacterium]
MKAIFKREFSAYFKSPIGYIFLTAFYAAAGVLFGITAVSTSSLDGLLYLTPDMSTMFTLLFYVLMVLIPILTMRTMSEEMKNKTDQCLLTAPISLGSLVVGKFLAAFCVYAMGVAATFVYAIVINFFVEVHWLEVMGTILGLLLIGASFIAICMFVSSLTENQVTAAVGGFAAILVMYLISSIASIINVSWISNILYELSVLSRYSYFTYGIFDFSNVLFFISMVVVFLFLTVRVVERRRWS